MSRKEDLLSLLASRGRMTQGELAQAIYGDTDHTPYVHSALMALVASGKVDRAGSYPSYYSLAGAQSPAGLFPAGGGEFRGEAGPEPQKGRKQKKRYRDISGDIISNESLEEVARLVEEDAAYGAENRMITRCLQKFPKNTDPDVVAMKIGLIDITNSTHLSQHKSLIHMEELSRIIASIPDIDARIQEGDPGVINEIARSNGRINLFSFASKYCCYHNRNLYGKDDYSILDMVVRNYLPLYFPDITRGQIQNWQNRFEYGRYNDYITGKLDELGITTPHRKRKFDHFVWYKNREGSAR